CALPDDRWETSSRRPRAGRAVARRQAGRGTSEQPRFLGLRWRRLPTTLPARRCQRGANASYGPPPFLACLSPQPGPFHPDLNESRLDIARARSGAIRRSVERNYATDLERRPGRSRPRAVGRLELTIFTS